MEMFSAADEEQWALIKRQIEQSDYYIVIVAHRYGSMAGDVSFTEREYDYALQTGVPVLGFIIEDSAGWPATFIDKEPSSRSKLGAFKTKIRSRMVSFWPNADTLAGKVLAALAKQKNLAPRPGGAGGSGSLASSTRERLVNAGVIRLTGNRAWRLSNEGRRFAEWLIKKGRRCDLFWTPVGGWGEADPGTKKGASFLQMKQAVEKWSQDYAKNVQGSKVALDRKKDAKDS